MNKTNLTQRIYAFRSIALLLSTLILALNYEICFMPCTVTHIIIYCNIVVAVVLSVIAIFWNRLKDSAQQLYIIYHVTSIVASILALIAPPAHLATYIAFAVIIAIDSAIIAILSMHGTSREEWDDI